MAIDVLLIAAIALCLLGSCGVGGWFLINRARDSENGVGPLVKKAGPINSNNPDDFVQPGASVLIGINTKKLRDANQLDAILKQLDALPDRKPLSPEQRELLQNSERVLISNVPTDEGNQTLVGIVASNPEVLARLKKLPDVGAEEKLGSYRVHRPDPAANLGTVIVFPGDRLVLIGNLEDRKLTDLLDQAARERVVTSPVAALAKTVETSEIWTAWRFDEEARRAIRTMPLDLLKGSAEITGAVEALQRAKGGTLSADHGADARWNVQLGVECVNAGDSKKVKDGVDAARVLAVTLLAFSGQGTPTLLKDLNTISTQQQGPAATLTMQLSLDTLRQFALANAVKTKAGEEAKVGKSSRLSPIAELKPGTSHEYPLKLQEDEAVNIRVSSASTVGQTQVKIEVLAGERVLAEAVNGLQRPVVGLRLDVTAPAADSFRLRVTNLGPGDVRNLAVSVTRP